MFSLVRVLPTLGDANVFSFEKLLRDLVAAEGLGRFLLRDLVAAD